jgi:hypothetical protein
VREKKRSENRGENSCHYQGPVSVHSVSLSLPAASRCVLRITMAISPCMSQRSSGIGPVRVLITEQLSVVGDGVPIIDIVGGKQADMSIIIDKQDQSPIFQSA